MKRSSRRRRIGGFTLIELMITVAIVAILAAMAYASYSYAVVKSRRSAAAACLQSRAQFMERYYTTHMTYNDNDDPASLAQCDDVSDFYTLAFDDTPDATSFTISATPQGAQARADTSCGTLTINQAGTRTASLASDASQCW